MVIIIVLVIRYVLSRENKRRDALQADTDKSTDDFLSFGYVTAVDDTGRSVEGKVDKALLDYTDKENLTFRYVV